MLKLKFLRKRHSKRAYKRIQPKIAYSQKAVLEAVKELEVPSNMRTIAAHLGWDSGCVSPRLTELKKKGRVHIAYRLNSLDGRMRNYYELKR